SFAGCVGSNMAIASVTVYSSPVISVNNGTICSGGSFTMIPSGASTYTYLNGGPVVSPALSSTYAIVGTNSLGCVSSNTAVSTLAVNAGPVIAINNGTICSGQSFTLLPTGASSFTYAGGSNVVSPTVTTTYSVAGTSTAGCPGQTVANATITVNQ